jgi:hypothetical protein
MHRLPGAGEPFRRRCRDYNLDENPLRRVTFSPSSGRMDGTELNDIINEADAARLANHIRGQLDPYLPSLASGRKTMSFWLGARISLFGRPQDSLRLGGFLGDRLTVAEPDPQARLQPKGSSRRNGSRAFSLLRFFAVSFGYPRA